METSLKHSHADGGCCLSTKVKYIAVYDDRKHKFSLIHFLGMFLQVLKSIICTWTIKEQIIFQPIL